MILSSIGAFIGSETQWVLMSADLGVWPHLEVSNLNHLGKDMTILPPCNKLIYCVPWETRVRRAVTLDCSCRVGSQVRYAVYAHLFDIRVLDATYSGSFLTLVGRSSTC